ncbi:glycoside hydrolase [Clavulina sp. PMI_390]|nr:glycoside hydrolase [Clavulina sp. PMI_390]
MLQLLTTILQLSLIFGATARLQKINKRADLHHAHHRHYHQREVSYSVSGQSRIHSENPLASFSLNSFSSTVTDITSSVSQGSNRTISKVIPVEKIYGVNLGSWYDASPWIGPARWQAMGGQYYSDPGCDSCDECRMSEWSLAAFLGQNQTNAVFQQHWETWFTQTDVDAIVAAGLNTVRIPLGFWIVEDLVNRPTEPYAEGGLDQLIRGLTMLKAAGLWTILDHHALPGVSSAWQPFAGNCTGQVEFYSSPDNYNYVRGVTWGIVMTWLSHVHPAFETVFAIEAINEPSQDVSTTPNIAEYEESFVLGVRTIELALGVICDISFLSAAITDAITIQALTASIPIISKLARKYELQLTNSTLGGISHAASGKKLNQFQWGAPTGVSDRQRQCISTTFMNRDWQFTSDPTNDPVPNPAAYTHGPQLYDNHLYLNFGGVALNDTPIAYMEVMCNLTRVGDAAAIGDAPMAFGEWALSTAFSTTDQFNRDYGDAQKLAYSQGAGWIFWNFKVDPDADVGGDYRQWSYFDAVNNGLLTKKPDDYFDTNVCAEYGL